MKSQDKLSRPAAKVCPAPQERTGNAERRTDRGKHVRSHRILERNPVDQEGEILEIYITKTRDKEAKQEIGRWANNRIEGCVRALLEMAFSGSVRAHAPTGD